MQKSERIVFSVLLLFILLPNLLGAVLAVDLLTLGQRILYLLAAIAIVGMGLCLFRRRTFCYVMSAGFLFSAIEIVHLLVNQATTSMLFIFTIVKSEKGEFLELLSTYWPVVILFFGIWWGYFYLVKHYIQNEWLLRRRYRLYGIVVIIGFFMVSLVGLKLRPKFRNTFNFRALDMRTAAWVGVEKTSPINIVLDIYHLVKLNVQINQQKRALEDFRFGIPATADQKSPLVVLLIGETSRYDHWQINGYQRETSPRLMQRRDELVSFDSCYSVANLTTVSVPFILSRATPNDIYAYMREKSVVDAFHEAGYRTAWIADQSFNNEFLRRIAHGCDYERYVTDDGTHPTFVDTVLLAPLRHELAQTGAQSQMIVLHSLGCHFKYSSRYPDEYQIFTPDMKGIEVRHMLRQLDATDEGVLHDSKLNLALLNNLRTILVNSYDNAIRFTDYFIDAVIRELEKTGRDCILVYVGDHGENLLDDKRNMFLHGTFAGSQYEYHVPLLVWTSDGYRRHHTDKVDALRANQSKQMSTMYLFHSLLDLAGISYRDLQLNQCIARPEMQVSDIVYGLDANMQPFVITQH